MEKQYAKQIIEWAEEAKQYLTIRKEIILDENTTDQKLGEIVRHMYKSKVSSQNETIERTKQNTK
jgi:O-glycosyl hydrolase